MKWDEFLEFARDEMKRFNTEGFRYPEIRDEPCTVDEMLDEVRMVLDHAVSFCEEHPERSRSSALHTAVGVSQLKDYERLRCPGFGDLGHATGFFAFQLVSLMDRASGSKDGEGDVEQLREARLVAHGAPGWEQLGAEYREAVAAVLSGVTDYREFNKRQKQFEKRMKRLSAEGTGGPTADPREDAVRLADTAHVLRSMVQESGTDAAISEPLTVWEAFKRFIRVPLIADPPFVMEDGGGGDMMLCEWGSFPVPRSEDAGQWAPEDGVAFMVSFVRQLGLLDDDGEYDHLEHVSCSIWLDPGSITTSAVALGATGSEWGDVDDIEDWVNVVESSAALAALRTGRVLGVEVNHEEV